MKKKDDFFKEKKPWSIFKDRLLSGYLSAYFQKILRTRKPVNYFDCFAGKGRFEDGNLGSPLITLDVIEKVLEKTKEPSPIIRTYFIDSEYAKDLEKNLGGRTYTQIIAGRYEDKTQALLKNIGNENVFLYIDPYGPRCLNMDWFNDLIKSDFNSLEILLNFNATGFMRLACKCIGIEFLEDDYFDGCEAESYFTVKDAKGCATLNKIAGGDYWQKILIDFKERILTWNDTEIKLSRAYCAELRKNYSYVLDFPIRVKEFIHTKYRMIFATNNFEGCYLMAENMFKQKEDLGIFQRQGQTTFLKETLDFEPINLEDAKVKFLTYIESVAGKERLKEAVSKFYSIHGLICSPSDISDFIKELETQDKIKVMRKPEVDKAFKPRKFYKESNGNKIWLAKKND